MIPNRQGLSPHPPCLESAATAACSRSFHDRRFGREHWLHALFADRPASAGAAVYINRLLSKSLALRAQRGVKLVISDAMRG